jgi:hypothetical protein
MVPESDYVAALQASLLKDQRPAPVVEVLEKVGVSQLPLFPVKRAIDFGRNAASLLKTCAESYDISIPDRLNTLLKRRRLLVETESACRFCVDEYGVFLGLKKLIERLNSQDISKQERKKIELAFSLMRQLDVGIYIGAAISRLLGECSDAYDPVVFSKICEVLMFPEQSAHGLKVCRDFNHDLDSLRGLINLHNASVSGGIAGEERLRINTALKKIIGPEPVALVGKHIPSQDFVSLLNAGLPFPLMLDRCRFAPSFKLKGEDILKPIPLVIFHYCHFMKGATIDLGERQNGLLPSMDVQFSQCSSPTRTSMLSEKGAGRPMTLRVTVEAPPDVLTSLQ